MGAQVALVLLIGFSSAVLVSCNTEGDVLSAQKQAWKDPNNVLQSWNPTLTNPCTWFHITCNINNSVIRVALQSLPELPEFALSLRPEGYELPGTDAIWDDENFQPQIQSLKEHLKEDEDGAEIE